MQALSQSFICTSCSFEYNPIEGDVEREIQPGTTFSELPDNWTCPVCGATKTDFTPLESHSGDE